MPAILFPPESRRIARSGGVCLVLVLSGVLVGCVLPGAPGAEVRRVTDVMELAPGMYVADVGAGDGKWSQALARVVGDEGRVYATEVKEEHVEEIRRRARKSGLGNVTAILGDDEETGLAEHCCDAILLRLVYHHFTDPPSMRESLREALRPDGVLVVIDIQPQDNWGRLPRVPERGGHGISPDALAEEMTADGWEVVARFDEWESDEQFCLVFRHSR